MHAAKFVAIGVAHVAQVHLADRAFAPAWWVFAGCAAIGHAGCMEGIRLLGGLHGKTDGAAIAVRRRFGKNSV